MSLLKSESFHSSYLAIIGMHELHGRIYSNQGQVTNLFYDDPLSPLMNLVVTSIHLVVENLTMKTLFARQ